MKMTKAERESFVAAIKKGVKDKTTVEKSKDDRQTEDTKIEVVKENFSISKYLKGVALKIWDSTNEEEHKLYKALGQDQATRGGVFVPTVLSTEIIELLKEKAVIRSMPGVRAIEIAGDKLRFNRQDAASSITWGGENTTISEDTTMAFGDDTLELKKAVCLYITSRELLMNANVSIDAFIRNDMAEQLALEEDSVFLEGTGGDRPQGIYYHPRVVNTDLSAVVDFDNILDALYNVRLNNASINGWVTHPRTINSLRQLKDANGRYLYHDGVATDAGVGRSIIPNFYGAVLRDTTKIAITDRPSSNETYIVGGDWSQLIIGEKAGLRIESTTEGGDAFKKDQVHIKLVKFVGTLIRQPGAFVVIKGIQI